MTTAGATALLFQTDSMVQSFDATVISVDPERHAVVLDRTAFYPGGGGQPCDHGWLVVHGQRLPVGTVSRAGDTVEHILAPDAPLPAPGDAVTGELDWERRYQLMRTHTALHILCGVVFRDYGALVTGGNMDIDHARMDFEMDSAEFTPERVAEIGERANAEIAAGRDIRVQILPREEAFQIPDLIRTKINLLPVGIDAIRTVEIVGLDLQADGGTHVTNTREVGGIEITGTRSKGRINKRLTITIPEPPTSA
jgi:misacylated tRNA(Ala) deacylase